MINISTKDELLNKLCNYTITPDDNNIRYKEKIRSILFNNAELLYALNNKDLESELFDDNGNLILRSDCNGFHFRQLDFCFPGSQILEINYFLGRTARAQCHCTCDNEQDVKYFIYTHIPDFSLFKTFYSLCLEILWCFGSAIH